MTRQTKTPAQRAQENLEVAERIAARLTRKLTKARSELQQLERERDAAVVRRDYLAGHPDLPKQPTPAKSGDTA